MFGVKARGLIRPELGTPDTLFSPPDVSCSLRLRLRLTILDRVDERAMLEE